MWGNNILQLRMMESIYKYELKTMKEGYMRKTRFSGLLSFFLAIVLVLSMSTTAFAASSSKYKTSSKMTISLAGDTSGSSNTVTFNFNDYSIPNNATVTKVVINTPLSKHNGVNAIVIDSYYLTSPYDGGWTIPVTSGNSATSYYPAGATVKGTWSLYLNASCYDSGIYPYVTYSSSEYYPPKLTIYYEF